MSQATEPNEHADSPSGAALSTMPPNDAVHPKRRWTRTHVTWLFIALSLVPGLIISQFREFWHQEVPAAVRIGTYVVSGCFIVAACVLIVKAPGNTPPSEGQRSTDGA